MNNVANNVAEVFARNLKNIRTKYRLSQADVGDLIKRDGKRVYYLETGRTLPYAEEFEAICSIFNARPETFFPEGVPIMSKEVRARKPRAGFAQKSTGKPAPGEEGLNYDVENDPDIPKFILKEIPKEEVKETPVIEKKIVAPAVKETRLEIPVGDRVMKIIITFE
jgi:transcriptional regulator with XRE-family HTH domain